MRVLVGPEYWPLEELVEHYAITPGESGDSGWTDGQLVLSGYDRVLFRVENTATTGDLTVWLDQFREATTHEILEIPNSNHIQVLGDNNEPYFPLYPEFGSGAGDSDDFLQGTYSGGPRNQIPLQITPPADGNGGVLRYWMRLIGHGSVQLPLGSGIAQTSPEWNGDTDWHQLYIVLPPGSTDPVTSGWTLSSTGSVTIMLDQVEFITSTEGAPYLDPLTFYDPSYYVAAEVGSSYAIPTPAAEFFTAPRAYGAQPRTYQWIRGEAPLGTPAATLAPYEDLDFHADEEGEQKFMMTNALGTAARYFGYVQLTTGLGAAAGYTARGWSSYGFGDVWRAETSESSDPGGTSLRSGNIVDDNVTTVRATFLGAGMLKFWRKVSSEADKDILSVYVNGVLAGSWSGELEWQEITVPMTAPLNRVEWTYAKDAEGLAGLDAAFIDNVSFSLEDSLNGWLGSTNLTAEQLNDPEVTGAEGDVEGDGVPNIIEYFFDLSPTEADTIQQTVSIADAVPEPGEEPQNLTMEIQVPANPPPGITLLIRESLDLTTWVTIARYNSLFGWVPANDGEVDVDPVSLGVDSVTITSTIPPTSPGGYIRIEVQ